MCKGSTHLELRRPYTNNFDFSSQWHNNKVLTSMIIQWVHQSRVAHKVTVCFLLSICAVIGTISLKTTQLDLQQHSSNISNTAIILHGLTVNLQFSVQHLKLHLCPGEGITLYYLNFFFSQGPTELVIVLLDHISLLYLMDLNV